MSFQCNSSRDFDHISSFFKQRLTKITLNSSFIHNSEKFINENLFFIGIWHRNWIGNVFVLKFKICMKYKSQSLTRMSFCSFLLQKLNYVILFLFCLAKILVSIKLLFLYDNSKKVLFFKFLTALKKILSFAVLVICD